jgi:hypothetical protein
MGDKLRELQTPGEDAWLDEIMKASVGYNVRERLATVLRAYRANLLSQSSPELQSRSVQRRVALQKGEPVPTFEQPALEKRVKELESVVKPAVKGASPVCLDCNKAGLRNCSHFDECDGTWVYKPNEAEIRDRVLEEAVQAVIDADMIVQADEPRAIEAIRALKSQVSVTGASHDK